MNVNILKLIGLHEYVECFNIACYIMYCYSTVYACVNGKMAHLKSQCKRGMVTITKETFHLLTFN